MPMLRPASTPRIVLAHKVHSSVREKLSRAGEIVENVDSDPWSRDELAARCRDADALMAFMTEWIDDAFLADCPRLRLIAGALKGYNNFDMDACTRRGVAVTNVPDLLTAPTAELTIGLMISVARHMRPAEVYVRQGGFKGWRPLFYGGSINGSTVAILGAGAVGQSVLKMLNGFDCERLYVDKRPLSADIERQVQATRTDMAEALRRADFVVLGLHLTPATLRLVDDTFLSGMKRGAYLINPARGSLVDEAAVARALTGGQLGGYAADTFEMEDWTRPDRPRHIHPDLLNSDRTVLTPHIGSAVSQVREQIEMSAADSILSMLAGAPPETLVNPASLRHRAEAVGC